MYSQRRELRGRRMPTSRGKTLFQRLLALAATRPVFTASGHITLSGTGDVLSIHDWNDDTHVLTQADTARQCDPPAAEASLNNRLALAFNGSTNRYSSNRTASAFRYMHGNAPCFVGAVYGPRSAANGVFTLLVATSANNAATGYLMFGLNTATNCGQVWKIGNGSAVIAGSTTPVVTDTPAVATGGRVAVSWFAGGASPSPWYHRNNGAAVASGNSTGNPVDADSAVSLKLGANSGETAFMNCVWAELYFAPVDALATYSLYTQQTYGKAA